MFDNKRLVRYNSYLNTIVFSSRINSFIVADFISALHEWKKKRPDDLLTLDFSGVQNPYINGMLPIIATIIHLRVKENNFHVILPNDKNVRKLFMVRNWAHFLSPEQWPKKSESTHDRHLVTRQFTDSSEVLGTVNDCMDVVLRSISIPKDIISALEWSIYEICDNVLNHSESEIGGLVEVITYTKKDTVSFAVADAGRGILTSLKESIPTLRTDAQAIGEAIKSGVTRNKEHGQGNGLAGSLRITTMTGGSLDIISGTGRFISTTSDSHKTESTKNQSFIGTSVCGNIKMNKQFSIGKALDFGGPVPYAAVNIIDLNYEMEDQDCLLMTMKDETTGFGTRHAGVQLRTKTLNLLQAKNNYPIYVDWAGVPVISSSFADEFMGKLFVHLGPLNFSGVIRNKNMEVLVKQLLDKAISQRLTQA